MMLKQQKAKTYSKDKIKDLTGLFMLSKKYDGHQVFIEKRGLGVRFFTSNHKEFYIEHIAKELSVLRDDFIIIGEYLFDCKGKLGDRASSTKVTTFRTNFNKSLKNDIVDEKKSIIKIFDFLPIVSGVVHTDFSFDTRRLCLSNSSIDTIENLHIVECIPLYLPRALERVQTWVSQGWEGGMLIRGYEAYYPGKRVHHAIKLKGRQTADLECIGVLPGEGKYNNLIGSLVLRDTMGLEVSVGSGLSDAQRHQEPKDFLNKVIEIQYERVDKTYIQPVFIAIRGDKSLRELD